MVRPRGHREITSTRKGQQAHNPKKFMGEDLLRGFLRWHSAAVLPPACSCRGPGRAKGPDSPFQWVVRVGTPRSLWKDWLARSASPALLPVRTPMLGLACLPSSLRLLGRATHPRSKFPQTLFLRSCSHLKFYSFISLTRRSLPRRRIRRKTAAHGVRAGIPEVAGSPHIE